MRKLPLRLRHALDRSRLLQIALLCGFWVVGAALATLSGLPIPGGVFGMAILLALLASGLLRPLTVRRGAYWLLAEQLLFFVPAVMVLLDHHEMIGSLGLKLMAVILVGTLLVMTSTALTVELWYRWRSLRARS
jgi:holin-like protein